jgi:hypothetical protein
MRIATTMACLGLFWVSSSYASPMAECALSIKDYNKKFSTTSEWGVFAKHGQLVTVVEKGHKLSLEEKAYGSKLKRLCMIAGLSKHYYVAHKGSKTAYLICSVIDARKLSSLCDASTETFEFNRPGDPSPF